MSTTPAIRKTLLITFSLWAFALATPGQTEDGILGKPGPFLQAVESTQTNSFATQVDLLASGARIVGLGEVSHFTKECYELKQAIIQRLMEAGFDALILEVDFGQAQIWDQYVIDGDGDLDKIIAQSGWFTYRTEEFKALLANIRSHNLKAEKPFRLYGMEMTAINHNLVWLREYLSSVLADDHPLIAALTDERKSIAFQPHDRAEREAAWALYFDVVSALSANEVELTRRSPTDWATAQQLTEILRQFATYVSQSDFQLQVTMRDLFSTANVGWTMNQLGESSRVAIWAHNGHVTKRSALFSYDVLGHHLARAFGAEYVAVGFTFNGGEFGAFSDSGFRRWKMAPVTEGSITHSFAQLNSPLIMLNIRGTLAADNEHKSPLRQVQSIRTDISEYRRDDAPEMMQINLSQSFDWLVYFDSSSYPTAIEWLREPTPDAL